MYEVRLQYQFEVAAKDAKEALSYVQARIGLHGDLKDKLVREGSSTLPTDETWNVIKVEKKLTHE